MPYRRWVINQKISHERKLARAKAYQRAERVIKHGLTEEKELSDFPAVSSYLSSRFPEVDLSVIKLYLSPPRVMERCGWRDIGGCYIPGMRTILVKSEIGHHCKAKGKFQEMMRDSCSLNTDVEDVVVHEMIHAISDLVGRSSSKYSHMEEEFVYTNCIDFYRKKGMSTDDIVNNNFLPFCLHDVFDSIKDMTEVFAEAGQTVDEIRRMSKEEYQRFLNKKAEIIIPLIKNKAQVKARRMIELYNKYGKEIYTTSLPKPVEDESAMRFSSLDLE